jgi:hypothetical protein
LRSFAGGSRAAADLFDDRPVFGVECAGRAPALQGENAHLSENWIKRGTPWVLVLTPKLPGLSIAVESGLAKLAWFDRWKKSAVKQSDWRSVMGKFSDQREIP